MGTPRRPAAATAAVAAAATKTVSPALKPPTLSKLTPAKPAQAKPLARTLGPTPATALKTLSTPQPVAPPPAAVLPATPKPSKMTSLCDKCVALCCRYIALPIDNPTERIDYDNIRWYLIHENIVVFIEDKQWYIGILNKCKHLQPDNRCGIYETRPKICRKYTTDNCDYHGAEYGYDKLFTSAEQLREYAEEKLGRSIIPKPKRRKPAKLKRRGNRISLPLA